MRSSLYPNKLPCYSRCSTPAKNIEIAYVSFASRPIIKRLNAYEDTLTNLKREIDEYSVITSEQTCQCLEK